jgi:hypothetical protein
MSFDPDRSPVEGTRKETRDNRLGDENFYDQLRNLPAIPRPGGAPAPNPSTKGQRLVDFWLNLANLVVRILGGGG